MIHTLLAFLIYQAMANVVLSIEVFKDLAYFFYHVCHFNF